LVKHFLAKKNVTILAYLPYHSDLTSADLYLFPRLQSTLKEWRFCDAADFIKIATEELKILSQNGFQKCFQKLYGRWQKCMFAQGGYFEGTIA